MKKLFVIALLGISVATIAYEKNIMAQDVTVENCIACIKAGTSKEKIIARITELQEIGEITTQVAQECIKAVEAYE